MNKHNLHTTLSSKHWELLNKNVERYGSQQKALEKALESLENGSQQSPKLSPEEQFLLQTHREKLTFSSERNLFLCFLDAIDIEKFKNIISHKEMLAYFMEFYYQRPLKELSLKEVQDGLVFLSKACNWFDIYTYTDDGDYYTLKMYHSLGMKGSKINLMLLENLFDAYGARYESKLTDKNIFVKIYK